MIQSKSNEDRSSLPCNIQHCVVLTKHKNDYIDLKSNQGQKKGDDNLHYKIEHGHK